MSAFLFGTRAGAQVQGAAPGTLQTTIDDPEKTTPPAKPGDKLVTAVAALIPAEILTAHAVLLVATTSVDDKVKPAVTEITDRGSLKAGFWVLLVLSVGLYAAGRYKAGHKFDALKDPLLAAVPALAFVAWTALQRTTAFDAVTDGDEGHRALVGVACALFAIGLTLAFGKTGDEDG
jgi:hypothetical protein